MAANPTAAHTASTVEAGRHKNDVILDERPPGQFQYLISQQLIKRKFLEVVEGAKDMSLLCLLTFVFR